MTPSTDDMLIIAKGQVEKAIAALRGLDKLLTDLMKPAKPKKKLTLRRKRR